MARSTVSFFGRLILASVVMGAVAPASASWASIPDYLADANRLTAAGDLPAARLQLRNALKADPKSAQAHYQLALIDLHLGDPVAAEKEARAAQSQGYDPAKAVSLLTETYIIQGRFRDLLHDFPEPQTDGTEAVAPDVAAATLVARGRAQMSLDHADDADASFAKAASLAPSSPAPLQAQAQAALARKDRDLATQKVDAALKLAPNNPELLQLKAVLLADKGDADGAIAASNQAVAQAPGQLGFRLERAGLLIAFNRNEQARPDVDAVLAAAPANPRALYFRAVLSTRAGNFQAASNDLDQLSDFISHNPGAYLILGLVKQQLGQTEQAIDAAERYVAHVPLDPRGALMLARLQIMTKHPAQAVTTLTPLVNADTKEAAIYDLRAAAYTLIGQQQAASADYQKALALRPGDAGLLARSGAAELRINQPEAAASLLARSVSLSPDQPRTETLLAMALIDAGKFADAEKTIAALGAQPGTADTVAMLHGTLHLARYDLDAAHADFAGVLRAHPEQIDARLSLARVAQLQGNESERLRLLNEVLQQQPARAAVVTEVVEDDLRQGHSGDAIAVLEHAHDAAPADPGFMSRLASLYISTGQAQKALSIATPPSSANATTQAGETSMSSGSGARALPWLLARAEAQIALKQPEAAQATYRDILATTPNFVLARLQLARLLLAADRVVEARTLIDDGIAIDPQSVVLLRASVDIDEKVGGMAAALDSAAKLEQDPAHLPASRGLRGDLYVRVKQYDDAAAAYSASLNAAPSQRLAIALAQTQMAGGHADKAVEGLRAWHAQHPDDFDPALLLSDLELKAGKYDLAKILLTELLAKQPNDARVLNNLAWIDQQQNDPQAAVLAQRAYRLAPGPQTADTLGYILATSGTDGTAAGEAIDHGVSLLRWASSVAPADSAIRYHLAVAYRAAGQPDEAVKLLTALVATPGDFSEKPQAKQLLAALSGKP